MAKDHDKSNSSGWLLAIVGAAGLVIGATVTGGFNYLAHKGDLDGKMIELSVGILRAEPTPETAPLRQWAIDVIEKRAKFSFNTTQKAALLKQELPFKGGFSWDYFVLDKRIDQLRHQLNKPLPPERP